jgi:hypothetical protein
MRLLKRKCIGGPLDGQELLLADHVTHYRVLNVLSNGYKFSNYELKNEEFHYVGCSKCSVK